MTIELRRWQAEAFPLVRDAIRARQAPVVSAFMGSGKSIFAAELVRQSKEIPGRSVVIGAPAVNLVEQLAGTMRRYLGDGAVGEWCGTSKDGDKRVVVSTYHSLPTLVERWKISGRSASFLICDECHKTEAAGFTMGIRALEALNRRADGTAHLARLGLTATPFRTSKREGLSLWDGVVYRYGWRDGVKDGVIVPWDVRRWDGKIRKDTDVDGICLDMLQEAQVWPTLASSADIEDAEAFAVYLSERGVPAMAVHSRLPKDEVARRVEMCRGGDLKVLVHVSMLAEGADFPWLRGLLMRRMVRARVRFVQEVGRVLRACPGAVPEKTVGVVFDPFDLMGMVGMTHPEAIGQVLDGDVEEESVEPQEGGGGPESELKRAVPWLPVSTWLTQVCAALEPYGLTEPEGGMRWRGEQATDRQVELIGKMAKHLRYVPNEYSRQKDRIRRWIKDGRIATFSKGDASDLISILRWVADQTKFARTAAYQEGNPMLIQQLWQWPEGLVLPQEIPSLDVESENCKPRRSVVG